ncbi:MAG: hypothetical protein ABI878_15280 [Acidobacteriota bacterium]
MKPGEVLINEGIAGLKAGRETIASPLVVIGAPRLRRSGVEIPASSLKSPETFSRDVRNAIQ